MLEYFWGFAPVVVLVLFWYFVIRIFFPIIRDFVYAIINYLNRH